MVFGSRSENTRPLIETFVLANFWKNFENPVGACLSFSNSDMFLQACNVQAVVLWIIYCILSLEDQQQVILITWFYDVQIRALVWPTNVLYVVMQSTVLTQHRSFQSEVIIGVWCHMQWAHWKSHLNNSCYKFTFGKESCSTFSKLHIIAMLEVEQSAKPYTTHFEHKRSPVTGLKWNQDLSPMKLWGQKWTVWLVDYCLQLGL